MNDWPMQKMSTPQNKTELFKENNRLSEGQLLEPKKSTVDKVLQFASTYRVEKINNNQYIDMFLN